MTSFKTYEFTAFCEADLVDGNLGKGSKFEMPANATVCFNVEDDGRFLSGDKRDKALDKTGQYAEIIGEDGEIGNGGKIYAEQYFTLKGSDGKIYYLIEIEQEHSNTDYFSFYGRVPAAGTELTVIGKHNVKGNWVDYKCLDAGDKEPEKWVFDEDCRFTVEAEHLDLDGYKVEHRDEAHNDALIRLSDHRGYASTDFGGEDGQYNIEITYVDESDGEGFIDIFVNGKIVGCISLDENNNGNGYSDHLTFSTVTLECIDIKHGDEIVLKGRMDGHEFARIDKIVFEQKKDDPLGSLSGRYFCDDDRDGLDNDGANGGPSLGVAGVLVELLEQNAAGEFIATGDTATTDSEGNYQFTDLASGVYGVKFTDAVSGKALTTQNVDDDVSDDIDSDAGDIGGGMSVITDIRVVAGQNTPDNDAGVVPNLAPTPVDDALMLCSNETVTIDVLANDDDPDGDSNDLTITKVDGQDIAEGGAVTLASGATVTLESGQLVYDLSGTDDFDSLPINDMAMDQFTYTVADANGDEATGTVDVEVKGALFTNEELSNDLGEVGCVTGQVTIDDTVGGELYAFDVTGLEFADARLADILGDPAANPFDEAYCLSIATEIDLAPASFEFSIDRLTAETYSAAVADANDAGAIAPGDGGFNPENVDNVNWLLNEADTLLAEAGSGFTEGDIQRAIWNLLDGGDDNLLDSIVSDSFFAANPVFGDFDRAAEITQRALDFGDDFVAGAGDVVGLILDPKLAAVQPFVIGVEFDTLVEVCKCDDYLV